jgi:hypothetical protein
MLTVVRDRINCAGMPFSRRIAESDRSYNLDAVRPAAGRHKLISQPDGCRDYRINFQDRVTLEMLEIEDLRIPESGRYQ